MNLDFVELGESFLAVALVRLEEHSEVWRDIVLARLHHTVLDTVSQKIRCVFQRKRGSIEGEVVGCGIGCRIHRLPVREKLRLIRLRLDVYLTEQFPEWNSVSRRSPYRPPHR